MNEAFTLPDKEKINFSEKFLSKFLENGFGTLPKEKLKY